jgi:hypothetical protein
MALSIRYVKRGDKIGPKTGGVSFLEIGEKDISLYMYNQYSSFILRGLFERADANNGLQCMRGLC